MPNYECPRCKFTTDRQSKMERHILRQYPCISNNKIILDVNKINEYITDKQVYLCVTCDSSFTTKYYLDQHVCKEKKKIENIVEKENKYKQLLTQNEQLVKENEQLKKENEQLKMIKDKYKIFFDQIDDISDNISNERKQLSAALRHKVWNKYIGQQFGIAKCFCCNEIEISQQSFECGHMISILNGGLDSVKNLRPICTRCNRSMGSTSMEIFMKTLE